MLRIALLAAIVVATVAAPFAEQLTPAWESWKSYHGKQYDISEEQVRRLIWEENFDYINNHNFEHSIGKHSYTMEMNRFGDLKHHEFRAMMNGYKMHSNSTKTKSASTFLAASFVVLPDTVDWRQKGYVTPVKDQGQCGSCWAFSTTGSMEGQTFKKTGKLPDLSEQNLVDCSGDEGNEGCNGGLMDQAFEYIKKNGGIDTEESYPYEAVDDTCRFKSQDVGATCTGYTDVESGNEDALKQAAGTVGPISVAIDASHQSFQFYSTGVYDEPECSSEELDHGVLVVGYGTESGSDYWLVKNSWGTVWGDQGYVYMSRNKSNQCGIATSASYPLV
ncbi:procathepsin L-like [Glandiceps talaboti]